MSNAPKVRGAFLTALNRPVLVRPSDAEATIVLDERSEEHTSELQSR